MTEKTAPVSEVERRTEPRAVYVPFATIGKFLATALALWVLFEIRSVVTLTLVAVVLAIAFEPIVAWLERHHVPRWAGSVLVVTVVLAMVVGFLIVSGSS